jgi:hypothetical protein
MALIDDIEFYGRAVAAGEMARDQASQLLAEASNGGLTVYGAETAIDGWETCRSRLQRLHFDTVDAIRALQNGRPVPEHVKQRAHEDALRMIRSRRDWDESPAEAARLDRMYWNED